MADLEEAEIRVRTIHGPGGATAVAHSVHCPVHHESRPLVDCETCERCAELTADASFVMCEVPPAPARRGPNISIRAVMSRQVECVTAGLSREVLAALLLDRDLRAVPVVDAHGFPIGVVSRTDLVCAEHAHGGLAGDLMTPVAYTMEETRPLADAIAVMATEGVHQLPIVDQDGRVVGMLSAMDIIRWLDGKLDPARYAHV